ncbi:transposase [Streptomyces azureus]|uniref:Transposase n=1 Tax=Streptomyces azureus TaxID=146537 RepID=A0A0K8PVI0_STRAJ|nr:hypothetical protein [Streptomyces azureus]GAP51718.1 transposase [Streptomyces azureus]
MLPIHWCTGKARSGHWATGMLRPGVNKITDDADELPAFDDFPAEHWIQLRNTNRIEPASTTIRLRATVTEGDGRAAAALAMVFKLVESARQQWRAVNAPRLAERPEGVAA